MKKEEKQQEIIERNPPAMKRVGGGYMNVEEFVKQKSKIELAKQNKREEERKKIQNETEGRDI